MSANEYVSSGSGKGWAARKSLGRVGWVMYAFAVLIPYLTAVYLILGSSTSLSESVLGIFMFTVLLVALGGITVRKFALRLKNMAQLVSFQVDNSSTEKLPVYEDDVEELYELTNDFNRIIGELERQKKESKRVTARMLSYINDLDVYEKKVREESMIRTNLSRYVGEDVVEDLIRTEKFAFENVECKATILFADIRGFTTVSEQLEPEETIELLNQYFNSMVPIIFKYGGTLDKFVGDELMAVFRDHPYGERAPYRAVSAAIEMIKAEAVFSRQDEKLAGLEIGIGINTGKVVIGNVGSENRKDYTAIGDTVNVAARFERIAGGGEIIIGKDTWELCKDRIDMEMKGEIKLKNRKTPVRVYKVNMNRGANATSTAASESRHPLQAEQ